MQHGEKLSWCMMTFHQPFCFYGGPYKNKDDLPNKGEPFLEYIWTNHIPVNQEREKTRLHIEDFKYETNELNDKLPDLKVYWHVRDDEEDQKNEKIVKKVEYDTEKEDEEID